MTRILIAEDDTYLQKAYEHILRKEGFEVEVAGTGTAALAKAETFRPNVILLDMLMPEMDGPGFLRNYDIINSHPDVKVIVFSNLSIEGKMQEMLDLGAAAYKTKAFFSPKEMVALINETIQNKTKT